MKAIVVHEFGGPEVMRVEEVPDPQPGSGEVVVRIRAAGVNPVDTYIRAGTYPRKPTLPFVPGSDGAGEIERVGPGAGGWTPGDRVYIAGFGTKAAGAGTYAEKAVCTTRQLNRLPARTTFAQGAALGVPYATAYQAIFHRARTEPGDTLLVHGATGSVGLAAVQMGVAHGMRVIGTGGTDRGLALVRAQGADVVVNHREAGYLDAIRTAAGSRGVDVILEMAAQLNLDADLSLLARHGRVVVVGNRGRTEIDARQAMGRDAAILGMTLFNATDSELVAIHAALGAGLKNGTLNPIIGRELSLAEAPLAHETIIGGDAHGKIVLVP